MFEHKRLSFVMLTFMSGLAAGLSACGSEPQTNALGGDAAAVQASSPINRANAAQPVAAQSNAMVVSALNDNLQASGIEQTASSAIPTDMPGVYWVAGDGMPPFFTDESGSYIIQGQIVALGDTQPVDITAKFQAQAASQALAAVPTSEMIIYPADGDTQSIVYAFTDADCGYCRKLHSEMADINAQGIEVRYLAWPRSEQTFPKMQAIWCSDDQRAAMDAAKAGEEVFAPDCTNPVQKQFELGASLGVRGTPAIFTESGQQIGGYLPADDLAAAVSANR